MFQTGKCNSCRLYFVYINDLLDDINSVDRLDRKTSCMMPDIHRISVAVILLFSYLYVVYALIVKMRTLSANTKNMQPLLPHSDVLTHGHAGQLPEGPMLIYACYIACFYV